MTIASGRTHAFRCEYCGRVGSGYPSESAAARAERAHARHFPVGHGRQARVSDDELIAAGVAAGEGEL